VPVTATVRRARPEDALAVAEVHVRAWRVKRWEQPYGVRSRVIRYRRALGA
jgi:hypothetical protein